MKSNSFTDGFAKTAGLPAWLHKSTQDMQALKTLKGYSKKSAIENAEKWKKRK